MIGNNELHLNQATMIEALQMWIDSKMLAKAPKVVSVEQEAGQYSKVFVVKTGDRETE